MPGRSTREWAPPVWALDADREDAWRLAGDLLDQTLSLPARSNVEGDVASDDVGAWAGWRTRFLRFAEESGLGGHIVPLPMKRDGDTYKGWLRMDRRRRRVLYSTLIGLLILNETDEEHAR